MGELYLRKEEVPITRVNTFFMPVHPLLLKDNLSIDESIAKDAFLVAVDEWWNDIQEVKKDYGYIPNKMPKLERNSTNYIFLGWESETGFFNNGFVHNFSINREDGTMLYNSSDINCYSPIRRGRDIDEDKLKEFINPNDNRIHAYTFHNLNTYPAALLLRNWSLRYMNEVFKRYL